MNKLLTTNTISQGHNLEQHMHTLFGNEYRPGPINRDALKQSAKQDAIIYQTHDKNWKMSEVISVLEHKIPVFSIAHVLQLSGLEPTLLTELLFKIPSKEMISKFGKRSVYYLFLAGYCYSEQYESYNKNLTKQYGQQLTNHLEIARYSSRRIKTQSLSLIQQFTVLAMLQTGEATTKQLTLHLSQDFTLQYLQLAKEKAHCGRVVGYEPIKHDRIVKTYIGSGMQPNIRADGPICIALLYKKQPVAIISGYLCQNNSLMINQMQKVSYDYYDLHGRCTKHGVHPIMQQHNMPRQQILFDVMKQFTEHYGITSLSIQGAANNKRTKRVQTIIDLTEPTREKALPNTVHLSPELAHQIYDCFAQQQGMIQNNQNDRVQTKKRK